MPTGFSYVYTKNMTNTNSTATVTDYVDFMRAAKSLYGMTKALMYTRKVIGEDKVMCNKVWNMYRANETNGVRAILDTDPEFFTRNNPLLMGFE